MIIFPQAPENNIRVISIFSENSLKYSQVEVHHQYKKPVVNLGTSGVIDTDSKPVSTAVNLPPMSLTHGNNIRLLTP